MVIVSNSLIEKSKQVSHDDDDGSRKSHNNLLDVVSSLSSRLQLWNKEVYTEVNHRLWLSEAHSLPRGAWIGLQYKATNSNEALVLKAKAAKAGQTVTCHFIRVSLIPVHVRLWLFWMWLTDGRDKVQEPLLWEERVLQSSEVQLQYPCHRVDIVLILVINQGIFTWLKMSWVSNYVFCWGTWKQGIWCHTVSAGLTPLKWVFNIIDLHLWSRNTEYTLLLQPWRNTTEKAQIQANAGKSQYGIRTLLSASWKQIRNTEQEM